MLYTIGSVLFWGGIVVVVYTYVGYGLLVWPLAQLRQWGWPRPSRPPLSDAECPDVTLLIAAYNEADILDEKLANIRALDYPDDKLTVLFVTDGSTDATPDRLRAAPDVQCLHRDERAGKTAAINRAMQHVQAPIVVFSDANAMLNPEALRNIVQHYQDPSVGAVAGEKRVQASTDEAAGKGEGLYWQYESTLKRWDDALYSVVGAAGELFSIRTDLFQSAPPDTILDDFVLTLRVAEQGYRIAYAPDAYAIEAPSASLADEMTRKVRICAGGFQAMVRLRRLFNPFRHGLLTVQFLSHRVLRWTLAPMLLPLLLLLNGALMGAGGSLLYTVLFGGQLAFYGLAGYGALTHASPRGPSGLYVPFYFCAMNAAVYAGFVRYLRNQQDVTWTPAQRAASTRQSAQSVSEDGRSAATR